MLKKTWTNAYHIKVVLFSCLPKSNCIRFWGKLCVYKINSTEHKTFCVLSISHIHHKKEEIELPSHILPNHLNTLIIQVLSTRHSALVRRKFIQMKTQTWSKTHNSISNYGRQSKLDCKLTLVSVKFVF